MMKTRIGTVIAVPLLVLACGASKPEPAMTPSEPPSAESATSSDAAPSVATPATSATSATEASPAASSTAADAGAASSASAAKPPVVVGEPKDECTPVGVDFEKRARPKVKDCYAEAKKKSPNLQGTVKIKITVDLKGKIKSVKVVEKTLPDPVAECMVKAVKATPFPEVEKCWDSTLLIPIAFPTPP